MIEAAVDAPTISIKGKGANGITQTFKITGDRHNIDFMDILLQAKVDILYSSIMKFDQYLKKLEFVEESLPTTNNAIVWSW